MIYYKKQNILKKIKNKFLDFKENSNFKCNCFFKNFLLATFFVLFSTYLIYLFLLPKYFNENNIENTINNYLEQNSKLTIDIKNPNFNPNYKLTINFSADYIKLKYNKNENFITIEKPIIEINPLTLFLKYIDLNKIRTEKITINTEFTKANRYACFDCFNFDLFNLKSNKSKFELRNIKIVCDKLLLNLYDENVNKNYKLVANNLEFISPNKNTPLFIKTKGQIKTNTHLINDFNLNLEIKSDKKRIESFTKKLSKLNYNPLIHADKYRFYTKSDINLKFYPSNKKTLTTGKISLNDLSFSIDNIKLPKNNLELFFTGETIRSNFDFNLINEQFIKINSLVNFSKNKHIEAKINSNDINLEELKTILNALYKIFNVKINPNEIAFKGKGKADLYLKSDFKNIKSQGFLDIKDAKIIHKPSNLTIENINSKIEFNNNKITFKNAHCFVNKEKFYIDGNIDEKTNLNLSINSDLLNISQVLNLIKTLPLASNIFPDLKNYKFNSGYLKISSKIKGTIKQPIFETNSNLKNLKVLLKEYNSGLEIENAQINTQNNKIILNLNNATIKNDKINLKFNEIKPQILNNEIIIPKTNVLINLIPAQIEGKITNFTSKTPELNIKVYSSLDKGNDYILINHQNAKLYSNFIIRQNKLLINELSINENNQNLITANGEILDISNKKPTINNLKVYINKKTNIILPKFEKLAVSSIGNLTINGNLDDPNITGNLTLPKITSDKLKLDIKDTILSIKNNVFYINILNGKFQENVFDLILQGQYKNNKAEIQLAQISMPYLKIKESNNLNNFNQAIDLQNIEIKEIKGNINAFEIYDTIFNSLNFKGNFKNNVLTITNFSSDIFNGQISGTGKYHLNDDFVNAGIILKNINVRLLSSNFKDISIAGSGTLNAIIDANFKGFTYEEFIKNLDAYSKFTIEDGELSQFAKLERFLQAGNILSQSILKLTLNSAISAISNQNTGYFKAIEGKIKIKNSNARIEHIKTQGTNMSLYLQGDINLLTTYSNLIILGKIPQSTVNVLGEFGSFSTQKIVDKMSQEAKDTINSITKSPFEKMFSTYISKEELEKIPSLYNQTNTIQTREFTVNIKGLISEKSSVQNFKWITKE